MITDSKKITIEGRSTVDGVEVSIFRAVFDSDGSEVSFFETQIDKEACKNHRKTVRDDRAKFEDYAYKLQEDISAAKK